MKKLLSIVVGLLVGSSVIAVAELNRPASGVRWLKGNLHTHSLWSDGNDFPDMITDWYKQRGYDFLGMSDHNTLNAGEKWVKESTIAKRYPDAVERYVKRFGEQWVQRRGSGDKAEVRLKTLAEYRTKFEEPGKFLLVQAEEITDKFASQPVHRCAMNLVEAIKPAGGSSVREVIENNLNQVLEQEKRTGVPMLPHLNHPNFRWGVTAEDIVPVVAERFFEVWNGHPGVGHLGNETHVGIERMWDIVNTLRMTQFHAPPLYGVGTDDSHTYQANAKPVRNSEGKLEKPAQPGRGWVMVRAASLSPEAIIAAMKAGDFYASSGVTLKDVKFDDATQTLTVDIDAEPGVTYTTHFIGTPRKFDATVEPYRNDKGEELAVTRKYSADIGKTFATTTGPRATYKLTGDELYVRAVITSSKVCDNPAWDDQKQQAWTQPVGWQKHLK
jgi:hypothetical protein